MATTAKYMLGILCCGVIASAFFNVLSTAAGPRTLFDEARSLIRSDQETFEPWSRNLGVPIDSDSLTEVRTEEDGGTTKVYFDTGADDAGRRALFYVRMQRVDGIWKLVGFSAVGRSLGHGPMEMLNAPGD